MEKYKNQKREVSIEPSIEPEFENTTHKAFGQKEETVEPTETPEKFMHKDRNPRSGSKPGAVSLVSTSYKINMLK